MQTAISSCILFSAALLISILSGRFLFKKCASWEILDRWLLALLFPMLLTVGALFFYKVLWTIYYEQNWIRIQKAFVLALGFPLYNGPHSGPALATIYGPVYALSYLPATLSKNPTFAVRLGGLLSILFFFLPVLWLHLKNQLRNKQLFLTSLLAFLCFCLVPFLTSSLRHAAFMIHADAPTLGLSALACACIYFRKDSEDRFLLLFSALFGILAVWTKQVAVPLLVALSIYLLLADGIRSLIRYIMYLFVTGAIISVSFLYFFDPYNMVFNMFLVPGSQPLKEGGWLLISKTLFKIIRESLIILVIALCSIFPLIMNCNVPTRISKWMRENRWFLFILVSFFMLPFSVWSSIKVGGSNNTLSHCTYYLLIAATLGFIVCQNQSGLPNTILIQRRSKKALVALSMILLLIHIPIVYYRIIATKDKTNFGMEAYQYVKKNPGKAYFPRLTLVHLLAGGKLYHTMNGIMDRNWSGFPLREKHFRAYIPPQPKIVAFSGEDHMAAVPLPDFPVGYRNVKDLPSFVVYRYAPPHE